MSEYERMMLMWAGLLLRHGLPDHQVPALRRALSPQTKEKK